MAELEQLASELKLSEESIQHTVQLLDDGNTVPFIARFRRDETDGLGEEQIRLIQDRVAKLRSVAERKQTIVKSIESQGKLTPSLADQIQQASSTKQLEDLYLPFRPKKQSLATIARQRGLESFAEQVLTDSTGEADLDSKAASFVSLDGDLNTVEEVLQGTAHLISEQYSERVDLRRKIRRIVKETGVLVCSRATNHEADDTPVQNDSALESASQKEQQDKTDVKPEETISPNADTPDGELSNDIAALTETIDDAVGEKSQPGPSNDSADQDTESSERPSDVSEAVEPAPEMISARQKKKQKKQQKLEAAYKDYFDFQQPLSKIPPHRILAINRGERVRMLRVKLDVDLEKVHAEANKTCLSDNHPNAEFLQNCLKDAITRSLLPSLDREVRRELSEDAELHAVKVFARNLKSLLLQPPVRGRRVLAIDPGFRSGCQVVALTEFGQILDQQAIHVVGKGERIQQGRAALVALISKHDIRVVAIGNGTACRESEELVSDIITNELKDRELAYVVVNEAGASVYSTGAVGREELLEYDPVMRSAISIGRRLLDPLSELVKINPANIGVGLYQHDVKAKHLQESLDAVVESCVNFVGVDVNSASPSLLRYVSGLNQLTARRLYDHRRQHGPFRNRAQLKEISGIGESTFVQAAGFLKITDGDNPLDATWIHPESYDIAKRLLEKLDCSVKDLNSQPKLAVDVSTDQTRDIIAIADSPPATETIALCKSPAQATNEDHPTKKTPSSAEEVQTILPFEANGASDSSSNEKAQSTSNSNANLANRLAEANVDELAAALGVGKLLVQDLLNALRRPGRDPREDLPQPLFRRGVMKLDDLEPEMELSATVLNVVDFGAFVDIGLSDSGLIHISRLADKFIRDPHDVVSVGDIMTVWVHQIDKERRRVSLTAIRPGSQRQNRRPPRAKNPRPQRPPQAQRDRFDKNKQRTQPPKHKRHEKPKRPAKPAAPITQEMAEGTEPLRSFSDLMQFYDQNTESNGTGEKESK